MTDISMQTNAYMAEKRGWLRGMHGTGPGDNPSATLDISKFSKDDHYPNGYIPSGTVLGKVTASGLYGPYDPAASDGTETAAGFLFGSLKATAKPAGALVVHGFVNAPRLPFQTGKGSLDPAARADLTHIIFD